VGLFLWRRWAVTLSLGIAVATLVVFAAFGLNILFDGGYEPRTVGALTLRSLVWLAIGLFSWRAWRRIISR